MRLSLSLLAFLIGCAGTKTSDDTGGASGSGTDADGDGFTTDLDCDDSTSRANPDAPEICDGIDNDCDGLVDGDDESLTDGSAFYLDSDGDGYGDGDGSDFGCEAPAGYATNGDDCDDGAADINPGADEICDLLDDDCDGLVDDADDSLSADTSWYTDSDGDGAGDPFSATRACSAPAGTVATGDDCNDSDAAISPSAEEVCDGIDNDCDFLMDDLDTEVGDTSIWYEDRDEDGYGNESATVAYACEAPDGYVAEADDCDDRASEINPDATEICDDLDNDCDGDTDADDSSLVGGATWYTDADGDGYGTDASEETGCAPSSGVADEGGDCDDADDAVNPGETDDCDALDEDCSGVIDDGGDCPCYQEWSGDSSYLFCTSGYSWTYAESYCEYYDYTLVTLDDATEDDWVYTTSSGYSTRGDWWIGYNDRSTEGTWVWESGSASTFTNWGADQPNGGSSDDCARYVPSYGEGWYDTTCSSYKYFVCEAP